MGASDHFLKLTATNPLLAGAAASWSALIASLPDAAWLVDAQTNLVVAANTAAHALLGSEPGALVGEPAESLLMTPEDLAYWSEALSGNPGPHQSEATIYCERGPHIGRSRRVRRSIQPFVHGESGQAFIMVVLNDLTERYETQDRLEQAMSELQATLESTADGILVTDLNGGIRAFNRRFSELWSLPQTLLLQRADPAVHAWLRAQVEDQEAYDGRLRELINSARLSTVDKIKLRSGVLLERCAQPAAPWWAIAGPRLFLSRPVRARSRAAAHHRALTDRSADGLVQPRPSWLRWWPARRNRVRAAPVGLR